jgi:hypothetical protein
VSICLPPDGGSRPGKHFKEAVKKHRRQKAKRPHSHEAQSAKLHGMNNNFKYVSSEIQLVNKCQERLHHGIISFRLNEPACVKKGMNFLIVGCRG